MAAVEMAAIHAVRPELCHSWLDPSATADPAGIGQKHEYVTLQMAEQYRVNAARV